MTDYNAANERHIAIQRRSAKALEESYQGFINHIASMVDGRSYLHDLLTYCHVFDQPFATDPCATAFGCGQLDVGQVILRQLMRYCPDEYIKMMREANARSAADDARRSRSDKDADGGDIIPEYFHPGSNSGNGSPPTADTDEADYNPVERDED
jgi:hypothetical protein